MATTVETARNRRRLAADAGYGATSFPAVLAGTLVALGAIALVMAVVGAVGSQLGLSTSGISTSRWRQAGIGGAMVAALVLFASFWFGGYTAGRMGRRAGARHGLLVFVLAMVAIGVVVLLAATLGDPGSLADELNDNGVPTDGNTWNDIGIGAAVAAGLAMLLGSLLGGTQGDRWHGKLMTSAITHRRQELERGEGRDEDHAARRRWYQRQRGDDRTEANLRDGDRESTARQPSVEAERADHVVDH